MGDVPSDEAGVAPAQTAEVIDFPGGTLADIPCEDMFEAAKNADLECAIVIGREKDGSMYFAMSSADVALAFWLMELFKKELLSDEDE